MKSIEVKAKKVDIAINEGLAKLGVSLGEAKVEVLEEGGLFKKALVRITVLDGVDDSSVSNSAVKEENVKSEPSVPEKAKPTNVEQKSAQAPILQNSKPETTTQETAKDNASQISDMQISKVRSFVEGLMAKMNVDGNVEIDTSHGGIDINLVTTDSAVIGHRGEVLDSIQLLTKRIVEECEDKYVSVNVDSQGYRAKREKALVSLAHRMANKCVKTGRRVVLEPMNNTHRKIIHSTLSDNDKVITRSEGREPSRRVVILLKNYTRK